MDPIDQVNALDALWSPDFDDYASGRISASQVRCVLCLKAPCECPPFGTEEYFDLCIARHGVKR